MITRPMLPPRAGYVEAIDVSGNHVYKPTPETAARIAKEAAAATVQNDMDALTVDHEYRLTLLELGVTE
jgi:hypothetical protein